jgi:hypothetical protein
MVTTACWTILSSIAAIPSGRCRGRLSRLLVRVSSGAQPASSAGCVVVCASLSGCGPKITPDFANNRHKPFLGLRKALVNLPSNPPAQFRLGGFRFGGYTHRVVRGASYGVSSNTPPLPPFVTVP